MPNSGEKRRPDRHHSYAPCAGIPRADVPPPDDWPAAQEPDAAQRGGPLLLILEDPRAQGALGSEN